jgi:peptidoglycan/LPS O-acetylase OafA/YrhL
MALLGPILNPASALYKKPILPKLTRDNDLDLIRFLLAACVVFFHTRTYAEGLIFPLSSISAVPVFLFLSGLLVTESFYGSPNLKSYVEKRVRRIYPAYLFAVIFGGLIAFAGWKFLTDTNVSFASLAKYLSLNAFFANWLAPCVTADMSQAACEVNGSLWIMKWEVLFYAALPLILILFSRLNKFVYIALILVLGVRVSVETSPYIKIFICFLMGISAYYLKGYWMPWLKKIPSMPPLLRQCLILGLFFIAWKLPYGLFLGLLMLVAFLPTSSGPKVNVMQFGDISYGVFLIHFPLITGLYALWPSAPGGIIASSTIFITACLISIVMYKYIEAPFLLPSSYYRKAHSLSSDEGRNIP